MGTQAKGTPIDSSALAFIVSSPMKAKTTKPRLTIADAVYSAIDDVDGGSEKQVMKRASKLCGWPISEAQFKRALKSFDTRGCG
jgi:hypothetical protein